MDSTERITRIEEAATTGSERLWILGEWKNIPIKRVRSEWLILNINNRRFTAERKLFENQLGRPLDPENNPNDILSIESILLDRDRQLDGERVVGKPRKEYLALLKDWQNRKQESPFWIRPDGTVRNGNRRLAMLHRLHREEGVGGNEYVDVVVLDPNTIDEIAMFEMEQREQLTEDYKVRYTDINLLLAIKDAADNREIDWFDDESIVQAAGELQHVMQNSKQYAIVQLYAIKYMDAYLSDLGQEGNYDKLIGQIERFRDVGKIMRQIGLEDPDREHAMLEVLFAAINTGQTHLEIRKIRTLFKDDPTAFDHLAAKIADAEDRWDVRPDNGSLGNPEVIDIEYDDFESDDDPFKSPGPIVTNYPYEAVRSAFEDARDKLQVSQTNNALKTVKEINTRLDILANSDTNNLANSLSDTGSSELRDAVDSMLKWFDDHESSLR